MAVGIPGVDEQCVLDLYEGDMDLYESILLSFVSKTPEVLNSLHGVSQETLADYINNIHALKGACANICAEEARKKALKLETAAKSGDLPGVLADNEAFSKYMEDLLNGFQNWLKNHQK